MTAIQVQILPCGRLLANCLVVWNDATRGAVVFDPTDDPGPVIHFVRARNLDVRTILLTHGHIDHSAGTEMAMDAFGVAAHLHPDDMLLYRERRDEARMRGWHDLPQPTAGSDLQPVRDGQLFAIDDTLVVRAIHVPGHSPGSVAYWLPSEDLVIAGDVLFYGGVGRTDLPGGDEESLLRSISERLYRLPENTCVVAGHGATTSVGWERRTNPFIHLHDADVPVAHG